MEKDELEKMVEKGIYGKRKLKGRKEEEEGGEEWQKRRRYIT